MPSSQRLRDGLPAPPIRAAARADVPALLDVVGELARHHGDEARASLEGLEGDLFGPVPWASALVAEQERALLGYAILCRAYRAQFGERGIDLHHLFVAEQARGKGLGRCLVDAALREARLAGCAFVVVGTHPENVGARRFFESLGFERAAQGGPRFRLRLDDEEVRGPL